ncbi:VCBS domain-containing protein [Thalassotalea sp. 1_MG-2023]|uniref:VCBS domain-containing protein n=1 Tax=Thalassotalea sp. 1_MG-2023 TaxID=3062680 RepID=UPI0026E11D66|nr:VCBS domain-containing protein [Thalassotalea sp. 1_MG-2023]MDO6427581.1 VCBS domain-containing protein [Thalassotalea sp. 1_MG-2023]
MKNLINKSIAVSAIALAVTGCNTDELPKETGNAFGQISLSGAAKVGETLTVAVTDGNGVDTSAITYSWLANDVEISGASSSSFTVTSEQVNTQVSVIASYTDNDNYQEKLRSSATNTIIMNADGMIEVSGIFESGKLLTATLTDDNGVDAQNVTYTWLADDVAIEGATESTLALTDDEIGKTIVVTATYTDDDDYSEEVSSTASEPVAPASGNTAATFEGLTAAVTNDETDSITGTVVITDADVGESSALAQTDTMTTFGTFSIQTDGQWTYTLDTTNPTVTSLLDENDTITDTISISSADGTLAELNITISGVASFAPTKVAKITDNMTDDAGELRYKLSSSDIISAGKLTVSFLKEDGIEKDAYIGLYGSSTSTSNALIDLRIQSSGYVIRNNEGVDITIPFSANKWTDVEMTWDASNASDTVAPLLTLTINGTSVTTEPFASVSQSLSDVVAGVQTIIFKLGDNSSTTGEAAYYIDNFKLYSDLAGTTVQFEDDFESYMEGDSLDDDNSASPYNSSTAETVVAQIGSEGGAENPDNLTAKITDNMTDDAGELRYKLSSSDIIPAGKLSVAFLKEAGIEKDAYIGLYGSSTSTSNAIIDLRIQSTGYVIRNNEGVDVTIPFTADKWTNVDITWDASNASDTVAPLLTLTIDGTSVTTEPFASVSQSLSDVIAGVQTVIFKLGDNSSTLGDAAYFIDEVKLYSDLEGTVIQFEDDFESYSEGSSLDDDNSSSPYNSSSAEVVVAKKAK